MVGMNQPVYREHHDMAEDNGQNGNVSRLLNQVQKELAIMDEELGGLADRLKSISAPVPTEAEEGMVDGPKPPMSPLAETVQMVLGQVRRANTRIRDIKLGVDL